MHTLVLLGIAITSLVLVGGAIMAVIALRRAPDAVEDEHGFHVTGGPRAQNAAEHATAPTNIAIGS